MSLGDPTRSPRRRLRPAVRVACALLAGLAFAAAATADVCPSHLSLIYVPAPSFGPCPAWPRNTIACTGKVVAGVSVDSTGGTAGGGGVILQILQSGDSGGTNPSVVYTTNWQNTCNLPCGSNNNDLTATNATTPATVTVASGTPLYYATKGFVGTNVLTDEYHSPCDGQAPWIAIYQVSQWVAAPCP